MFKDFDIQKYLNKKPPSDGSFTTTQEIKELNSIPINERFVKEKDDIKSSFLKLAKKKDLNISSEDLDKVIAESAKVILKIKKHHNRPRPKVLAKKNNIKFAGTIKNNSSRPILIPRIKILAIREDRKILMEQIIVINDKIIMPLSDIQFKKLTKINFEQDNITVKATILNKIFLN